MFKLWGLKDAVKSGCGMVSKTFAGAEYKMDEWLVQEKKSRVFRDKASYEAAFADAAESVQESNKRLAKLKMSRDEFLAEIAAFAAANQHDDD